MKRRWLVALFLPCFACTADDAPGDETDSTETDSTETESGDTGELGPLLIGEPTIVHHPKQPMIIDVIVELDAPGTGELVHLEDDGVQIALLEPDGGEPATTLHFRVRGLLPDASHPLELAVSEAGGDRSDAWSGSVTTDPRLPGFVATFELTVPDAALVADDLRLLDATPLFSTDPSGVFLVDNEGRTRWYLGDVDEFTDISDIWSGIHLRDDGTISYVRRDTGYIIDELGEIQMEVEAADIGADTGFHHDITELENGNFLVLGYSFRNVDYQGEGTIYVAGDVIWEFTPAGELVWSWDSFDHLDPQRRRDGFNLTIPDPVSGIDGQDWTHGNGIIHTAADDVILFSMRHQDWIIAIDHGTGEILWRLGDEGDFELIGDQYWFFHQHSPQWQPDGTLLLYDNAVGNPEQPDALAHSRAVRYQLDFDAMTATLVWADDDPFFTSAVAGDADRMSSGHILRADSAWTDDEHPSASARVHELDPGASPNFVWGMLLPPKRFCYRAVPVSRWVGEAG